MTQAIRKLTFSINSKPNEITHNKTPMTGEQLQYFPPLLKNGVKVVDRGGKTTKKMGLCFNRIYSREEPFLQIDAELCICYLELCGHTTIFLHDDDYFIF